MTDSRFDTRPTVKRRLSVLPSNPVPKAADAAVSNGRFPPWLHRKLPKGGNLWQVGKKMKNARLNTVCEEARCPNLLECWSQKTATFLAMGHQCTRACGFCDIDHTKTPPPLDAEEPLRIAQSVQELGLKHVVITQVARDDLDDGGAGHLVQIIDSIRKLCAETTIELLTSDLMGNEKALNQIIDAQPDVFNHNIETVERLTSRVRHKATYRRTLQVLTHMATNSSATIKSGLMVGLGETEKEVFTTLQDLQNVSCSVVTIGQYLQASPKKLRVKEFVPPEQFEKYKRQGLQIGIPFIYSGPFVRSSYHARDVIDHYRANNP